jgi:selenocysteine-specific elongation factor
MRSASQSAAPSTERTTKNVIIGTAGHIDHGKSALVEALTGTHPDRLEEERRRGITIDLGFAFLELEGVRLGFVDVPGHERFVRNMLAGAGGIDVVLLVIAASEGIKPQTREHFEICRLLGIPRGIIALTKIDTVDPGTADLVRLEVEEFLRGSFLEGAPIVGVSSRTGAGMDEFRSALALVAAEVSQKDAGHYFRLAIDRAFAMKGFGTVVTGTLVSGRVSAGDEVELHPLRKRARVRGVQSEGQAIERAFAGQRTALNLAGVDLEEVRRGMVLTASGRFAATRHLDARITLLKSAPPLKNHSRIYFHQGAAHTIAEITFLEGKPEASTSPGGAVLAHLSLKDEVFLLAGDRFILRRISPAITMGGGTVLQTIRRKRKRDPEILPFLATIERGNREEILLALVAGAPQGISVDEIISRAAWLEEEVHATARILTGKDQVCVLHRAPLLLASKESVDACCARIRESITNFHSKNPLAEGMSIEALRSKAGGATRDDTFRASLERLASARELAVAGDTVKLAGRTVALSPEESHAQKAIESAFLQAGIAAPSTTDVLEKAGLERGRAQSLLQLLLREGVLIRIAEGYIIHRSALIHLRQVLENHRNAGRSRVSVPGFKELTGVTRKYAIPLLEYLDRAGVTRREGDERVIIPGTFSGASTSKNRAREDSESR